MRRALPLIPCVRDREFSPCLKDTGVAVAVYAAFGHDSDEVMQAGRRITAQLNAQKLPTHEEVDAQQGGTFIGLKFGSSPAVVSVKDERV